MIKARHHPFWLRFFRYYTRLMLRRHFYDVQIVGNPQPGEHPLLLIGNHVSWWDGFWVFYANDKLWQKKFHIMMLEEELQQRMFLNKAGCYSIKKQSRDVINSLRYTVEILKEPGNLAALYPQGEIRSMHEYPVRFERGISYIIRNLRDDVHIIFMAAITDYFSSVKPHLRMYFETAPAHNLQQPEKLEANYNAFLLRSYKQQVPERFPS